MDLFLIDVQFGTPEYDELVRLRTDVLRKPLNMEFTIEQLSNEYNDFHFGFYDKDLKLIGCLIFNDLGDNLLKMRQVAIDFKHQNKGLGKKMVEQSEEWARQHNYKKIELNARDTAIPFYKSLKYLETGPTFIEVSILHQKMYKII